MCHPNSSGVMISIDWLQVNGQKFVYRFVVAPDAMPADMTTTTNGGNANDLIGYSMQQRSLSMQRSSAAALAAATAAAVTSMTTPHATTVGAHLPRPQPLVDAPFFRLPTDTSPASTSTNVVGGTTNTGDANERPHGATRTHSSPSPIDRYNQHT